MTTLINSAQTAKCTKQGDVCCAKQHVAKQETESSTADYFEETETSTVKTVIPDSSVPDATSVTSGILQTEAAMMLSSVTLQNTTTESTILETTILDNAMAGNCSDYADFGFR